jgi:hypothetical protein
MQVIDWETHSQIGVNSWTEKFHSQQAAIELKVHEIEQRAKIQICWSCLDC